MFEVVELDREGLPAISLSLQPRELVCLRGASGCGKTQLLRALVDLDCNQGDVRLGGQKREAVEASEWRRRVALLPAESRWWHATVGEHFPPDQNISLKTLGFDADSLGWRVERLSSGEKQRLALLRVLANRPEVLLLDEPSANLDADNGARMEALVRQYLDDRNASCLWVSHDAAQCARIADRTLTMSSSGLEVQS